MKAFARWSLMGSGLGLILLTASPSFADVVSPPTDPTLNLGGTGTVSVTSTSITFTENDTNTGTSTQVGTGTDVPGLTLGEGADIGGGAPITPTGPPSPMGVFPVDVPITFSTSPGVIVTLTSFGAGVTNTDCNVPEGGTCSPLTGLGASPVILTNDGTSTTAILAAAGTIDDDGVISPISGVFSANIPGETPEELATLGAYTTTYSAAFNYTAVPEPRTISLIALAGLLIGIVVSKRRKSIA